MAEDNTIFVLQKALNIHKAKVTKATVKEFLLSHPHYPSLKSVCDGLKKWNIDHYPLKLSKEEILEIEPPYIAHMGSERGQLAMVEKIKNGKVTFTVNHKRKTVQKHEEFSKNLSGGVIVMEPNQQSGEIGYKENRQNELIKSALLPLIVISIVLLLLSIFYSGSSHSLINGNINSLLFITKALGIVASVFLILHEFKIHTKLSDKICGFSSRVDCDSVLSSDVSRLFGNINLADIGIIYFTSTLIYLSGVTAINQLWLLAAISAVSVIFPVYSIYYQGLKLKKWCPFCMAVQIMLIAEFIILFPLLDSISISFVDVLRIAAFFALITAAWLLYKSYYELSGNYSNEHHSFLSFKSNPGIFRFLLQENGCTDIPENSGILAFGNPDAKVTVTAFLSLSCSPCAGSFKEIKALLDNASQVRVNVVLSVSADERSQKIAGYIYKLYKTDGKEKALELLQRWYSRSRAEKNVILKSLTHEFSEIEKIAESNKELFEMIKIPGTPTIYINGYRFPRQYKVSDIEYFIDEITSLTMESKGQEACSHCK